MILADTSGWVNHFRHGNPRLSEALLNGDVLVHPFVIGEIACGNLKARSKVLGLLEQHRLFGAGIVDIQQRISLSRSH